MNQIREKRLALGLSQVEVAVKCGVALGTYVLWERGAGKPSEENRKKLEAVLGTLD